MVEGEEQLLNHAPLVATGLVEGEEHLLSHAPMHCFVQYKRHYVAANLCELIISVYRWAAGLSIYTSLTIQLIPYIGIYTLRGPWGPHIAKNLNMGD